MAQRKNRISPLSAEYLRSRVNYDPLTGIFTWRERSDIENLRVRRSWNGKHVGCVVGNPDGQGYLQTSIDGRRYRLHQLAWLYATGEWPPETVDHKNGKRDDNRLDNLRLATNQQNQSNRGANHNSRSGRKGVSYDEKRGKWSAGIMVDGTSIFLGRFDSAEEASRAYERAARQHFGEFHSL